MLNKKKVSRVKGAGFLDFFNSIGSKVGSFLKSPTLQSIKTGINNFANTDVGKAVVSAGKDIAIAGATGAKDMLVEKIKNATAKKQDKEASQAVADYLSQSIAYDPEKFRSNPNKFMQDELDNLGLTPVAPKVSDTKDIKITRKQLQDTYGYGIDVRKVNKLIKKVSGKGLAKLN